MEEKIDFKSITVKEKLQEARVRLKGMNLEKSGLNNFTNSKYYTLSDILPAITRVGLEVRITPTVTFTKEVATLTIFDMDSDERLVFESPMIELNKDSKMSLIQVLGSIETYQRRFLLLNAFDIIEEEEDGGKSSLSYHDIFAVKQRVENLQTDLLKKGLSVEEIAKGIGLKDEKQLQSYISFFGQLHNFELKLNELLISKD